MTTRRNFLVFACGLAAGTSYASPDAMQDAILAVTGGKALQKGRVRLDVPPLIENGNSVVMTVTVDSPTRERILDHPQIDAAGACFCAQRRHLGYGQANIFSRNRSLCGQCHFSYFRNNRLFLL